MADEVVVKLQVQVDDSAVDKLNSKIALTADKAEAQAARMGKALSEATKGGTSPEAERARVATLDRLFGENKLQAARYERFAKAWEGGVARLTALSKVSTADYLKQQRERLPSLYERYKSTYEPAAKARGVETGPEFERGFWETSGGYGQSGRQLAARLAAAEKQLATFQAQATAPLPALTPAPTGIISGYKLSPAELAAGEKHVAAAPYAPLAVSVPVKADPAPIKALNAEIAKTGPLTEAAATASVAATAKIAASETAAAAATAAATQQSITAYKTLTKEQDAMARVLAPTATSSTARLSWANSLTNRPAFDRAMAELQRQKTEVSKANLDIYKSLDKEQEAMVGKLAPSAKTATAKLSWVNSLVNRPAFNTAMAEMRQQQREVATAQTVFENELAKRTPTGAQGNKGAMTMFLRGAAGQTAVAEAKQIADLYAESDKVLKKHAETKTEADKKIVESGKKVVEAERTSVTASASFAERKRKIAEETAKSTAEADKKWADYKKNLPSTTPPSPPTKKPPTKPPTDDWSMAEGYLMSGLAGGAMLAGAMAIRSAFAAWVKELQDAQARVVDIRTAITGLDFDKATGEISGAARELNLMAHETDNFITGAKGGFQEILNLLFMWEYRMTTIMRRTKEWADAAVAMAPDLKNQLGWQRGAVESEGITRAAEMRYADITTPGQLQARFGELQEARKQQEMFQLGNIAEQYRVQENQIKLFYGDLIHYAKRYGHDAAAASLEAAQAAALEQNALKQANAERKVAIAADLERTKGVLDNTIKLQQAAAQRAQTEAQIATLYVAEYQAVSQLAQTRLTIPEITTGENWQENYAQARQAAIDLATAQAHQADLANQAALKQAQAMRGAGAAEAVRAAQAKIAIQPTLDALAMAQVILQADEQWKSSSVRWEIQPQIATTEFEAALQELKNQQLHITKGAGTQATLGLAQTPRMYDDALQGVRDFNKEREEGDIASIRYAAERQRLAILGNTGLTKYEKGLAQGRLEEETARRVQNRKLQTISEEQQLQLQAAQQRMQLANQENAQLQQIAEQRAAALEREIAQETNPQRYEALYRLQTDQIDRSAAYTAASLENQHTAELEAQRILLDAKLIREEQYRQNVADLDRLYLQRRQAMEEAALERKRQLEDQMARKRYEDSYAKLEIDAYKQAVAGMKSATAQMFKDVLDGKKDALKNFWINVGESLKQSAADYLSKAIWKPIDDLMRDLENSAARGKGGGGLLGGGGQGFDLWGMIKGLFGGAQEPAKGGYGTPGGDWGEPAGMNAGDLTNTVSSVLSPMQVTQQAWSASSLALFQTWSASSLAIFQSMAATQGANINVNPGGGPGGGSPGGSPGSGYGYDYPSYDPSTGATYAEGAVVHSQQLAVIGEAGPEVVLPLRRPGRMQQLMASVGYGVRRLAEGAVIGDTGDMAPLRESVPVQQNEGAVTVINLTRKEELDSLIASSVARGSRVVVNQVIEGLMGNRAVRRTIQRTQ